jgi:hypothetical protein
MQYIIRHLFRDLGDFYVTNFFQELYNKIILKFPEHNFIIENDNKYENNGYGGTYSCMHMSIINPNNNKYIVISFFDNWRYLFMRHLGWCPDLMSQFFYCGGFNFLEYFYWKDIQKNDKDVYLPTDIDKRYFSFFYGPYNTNYDIAKTDIYNEYNLNTSIPKLYFRGYFWDFRKEMVKKIKNKKDIIIIDKNTDNNNLNYIEYLQDLAQYRAALSLPGGTEICNRDIECFSVGVPVLRPNLSVNYPDPLIPNYHYISFYDICKYWEGYPDYASYNDFQICLIEHWNKVKNDTEYLNFISKNARDWYFKNCKLSNNVDYVLSKINLGGLYG